MSAPSRFTPLPCGVAGTLCPSAERVAAGLGEFTVAGDGEGGVLIVQADPRIAITGMLLRDWHGGTPGFISLQCHGDADHIGDVIRIEAAQRAVVYVIMRVADRANGVWEARWPD